MKKCIEPLLAIGVVLILIYVIGSCFASRIRKGEGGTPLVQDHKVQIVGAAGDVYTVSSIKFVDKNGKTMATINAGPPPTIELVMDDKGTTKVLDLRSLARKASFFGEQGD